MLEALRVARGGSEREAAAAEVPSVALGRIKADAWDAPREPLPSLRLSFETPPTPAAVLRQLGTPAGWSSDGSPADALGPTIRAAAERARALAMAEEGEANSEAPAKRAGKRRPRR